ncbi:MAG: bifunctional UDP-N-acetylglucosamine diphosphorylase/glucosamine-1-phosphate N-acetyltransferase GlmU [bacterium]
MPRTRPGVGAILLMAGKGTRLKSDIAKIMHPLLGHPMGAWVLEACRNAGIGSRVLVIGHQADTVAAAFPDEITALQAEQKGTGHAVKIGLKKLSAEATMVLVINGDTPLLTPTTLANILAVHKKRRAACTLAVTVADDPTGLGRVEIDDRDNIEAMIEHQDCTPEQQLNPLVNAGCYVFDRPLLEKYLKKLSTKNAQGEEYLTDVPTMLRKAGETVVAYIDGQSFGVMPNTRADLAHAAALLQFRVVDELYAAGVSIPQPDDVYIEPQVQIAADAVIWGGTYLRGKTVIEAGAVIGPCADITDSVIRKGATVRYSVVAQSEIGAGTTVGPYAHVREHARVGAKARIGNFVELKKSTLADGVKAGHLTYLGDATIGANTNIGAGTITCNYDGVNKHPTTIGREVFIGSNASLVAPVTIGDGAMTAAGSTITKDVPPEALAFGRARQENHPPQVLKALQAKQRALKSSKGATKP